ncbi:sedoheptulose 7-phosphate cyclase [Croceicoccus sp. F390]|uniref:Sedoheptulose 7-phosphate cyclase n=1 Tax=Croceicoccus esteveae TaxID=3075597 RepID=A0ABU2ZH28_9SPHN|nr:sedoheptulose 7-phosphate cyclase [Croceicoccus sp. F390]MDT0575907.1 sedoheptulose 7-phosphate cyclase [Croceicoccus sp. F390]
MTSLVETLTHFAASTPAPDTSVRVKEELDRLAMAPAFQELLETMIAAPVFSPAFGRDFAARDAVDAIAACRMLRGALNLPVAQVFHHLAQALAALGEGGERWHAFATLLDRDSSLGSVKLREYVVDMVPDPATQQHFSALCARLVTENPHALYPTSPYRISDGTVESSADERTVEAVMSVSTFASIKVVDDVLDPANRTLRDIYHPLGRCVCFIDHNVEEHYGDRLSSYFAAQDIPLEKMVFRAMEIDKGIATVEKMLGELKRVGIARHEPVLIMGGGVLADTGGLACALYGRNTPYVMLSTSIVTGIDAGPSPRTCCDGFGYKNLLGAYHPPVVSLTDRFFFGSLREGWVRHGIAEIIKMAVVKNAVLFADLEDGMSRLVETRFGTVNCTPDDPIHALSQKVLAGALKSYIEAEYDNLYETHQCRPHAYGHTWSPGFEIRVGLLHGHAVAIGMGLGAFLSMRTGWITQEEMHRILALISGYGLSLWHDILENETVMRESHRKIVQKRGGNLVAPVPSGGIGQCGYLNDLTEDELLEAIGEYRTLCQGYPRDGVGMEPMCSDVGLEDPSVNSPPLVEA